MADFLLLDIKTVNGWYFKSLLEGKAKLNCAKQLSYYADAVSQSLDADIAFGVLLVDRNTGAKQFFHMDYEDWRETLDALRACLDADILPPRDEDHCSACPLKKICAKKFNSLSEWIKSVVESGLVEALPQNEKK